MKTALITNPHLSDPDAFYAGYVAAHQGLARPSSELLNARLVLILANHVGDPQELSEALRLASASLPTETRMAAGQRTE